MSENPYKPWKSTDVEEGAAWNGWNEGFIAALDAVLEAARSVKDPVRMFSQEALDMFEALRKEVSP